MDRKYRQFKLAVISFKDSEKSKRDYMNFIIACVVAFRQWDGLIWSEAEEILDSVL